MEIGAAPCYNSVQREFVICFLCALDSVTLDGHGEFPSRGWRGDSSSTFLRRSYKCYKVKTTQRPVRKFPQHKTRVTSVIVLFYMWSTLTRYSAVSQSSFSVPTFVVLVDSRYHNLKILYFIKYLVDIYLWCRFCLIERFRQ